MWPFFEQSLTRYRELEGQLGDPAIVANRPRYTRLAKEHGALAKQIKPYIEYKKVQEDLPRPRRWRPRRRTRRCGSTRSRSWPSCAAGGRRCSRGWRISSWKRARPSTASSWKSGPAPAATRRPCSPATSTTCTRHYAAGPGLEGRGHLLQPRRAGRLQGSRLQRHRRRRLRSSCATRAAAIACSAYRRRSSRADPHLGRHSGVLAEPDEVQIEVRDQDIEWETMRAGGAGGQHVNKTESAVRIWYKKGTPEEMEVKCQDERSQHKNYDRALRILRSRLYELQQQKLHKAAGRAAPHADRLRRPRPAHPHLQFPAEPPHRPPHQPDPVQARRDHRRRHGRVDPALRDYDKKQKLGGTGPLSA